MALEKEQVLSFVASVARTRDTEMDCDACLAGMAEFAETQLAGLEVPDALHRIQEHLEVCPECSEEYETLIEVLREGTRNL